jgi:hypothetical protein
VARYSTTELEGGFKARCESRDIKFLIMNSLKNVECTLAKRTNRAFLSAKVDDTLFSCRHVGKCDWVTGQVKDEAAVIGKYFSPSNIPLGKNTFIFDRRATHINVTPFIWVRQSGRTSKRILLRSRIAENWIRLLSG